MTSGRRELLQQYIREQLVPRGFYENPFDREVVGRIVDEPDCLQIFSHPKDRNAYIISTHTNRLEDEKEARSLLKGIGDLKGRIRDSDRGIKLTAYHRSVFDAAAFHRPEGWTGTLSTLERIAMSTARGTVIYADEDTLYGVVYGQVARERTKFRHFVRRRVHYNNFTVKPNDRVGVLSFDPYFRQQELRLVRKRA